MNLTALQHSPFLQSLGWAIANSLWQAAALWLMYLLVIGVHKGASAKFKNNLSTILLSLSFVWFCITLFTKYFAIDDLPVIYQAEYYQANNSAGNYTWNEIINKLVAVLPYLSVAYLLLLILLSVRLINIYRFTSFIKSNGLQKPAAEWRLFTERVSRHMGISRTIRLWVSHHIDVPATIGFIKPVILIPLASVNQLSTDQLEAIILHELSHIKRNDYLINLFISIIETILFFNPFVVLLAKIIKRERENCCDDFVIQYQYDRHAYASALLSLEQFRNVNLKLAIGATSGKKQLLIRVRRIMEINSNTNFNYGQKLIALFLITGIICSVAWLSPQNNEKKKQQAIKKDRKIVPDRKTISAPKFETVFLNPGDNKIKNFAIKSPVKKELTRAELQLKELQDINLKEIAERESGRLNMLSLESKREISNKKLEKLNRNKFFVTTVGSSPALFFDNGTFVLSTKPAISWTEFNPQQVYAAGVQKLQAEWDKAQLSFSFDCDNMQQELKKYKGTLDQKQLIEIQQNIKNAAIEKLIRNNAPRSAEKLLRLAHINTAKASGGNNNSTIYFVDSVRAVEVETMNRSRKFQESNARTEPQNKTTTTPNAKAYVYTYFYGSGGNDNIGTGESQAKRPTKFYRGYPNGTTVPEAPATPDIQRNRPRIIPMRENNPGKIYVPKQTIPGTTNLRLEYRNGLVYINGKEIELPDTDEILAQVTLKGKKIQSRAKNVNIETGD